MDQLWQLSERAKKKVMQVERDVPNGLLSVETKPRHAVGERHSNQSRAGQTWPTLVLVRVMGWA